MFESTLIEQLHEERELRDREMKFRADNERLREALQRIARFPIHSEPVGGAYAMQDIAEGALKERLIP